MQWPSGFFFTKSLLVSRFCITFTLLRERFCITKSLLGNKTDKFQYVYLNFYFAYLLYTIVYNKKRVAAARPPPRLTDPQTTHKRWIRVSRRLSPRVTNPMSWVVKL